MENNLYLFKNIKFKKILLNPPSIKPGSFKGAGDFNKINNFYWLTSRSRTKEKRGYEVEIFYSKDGYNFKLANKISIKEIEKSINKEISSIEGQQLLYDKKSKLYYLYISIDIGNESNHFWYTILMTSKNPKNKWINKGAVIKPVKPFNTAKDLNITYIDGQYIGISKSYIDKENKLKATVYKSKDGIKWKYLGEPKIDGRKQPNIFAIDGKILKYDDEIIFIGSLGDYFKNGLTASNKICFLRLNLEKMEFSTLFSKKWIPKSKYEHKKYPIHTYFTPFWDSNKKEWKIIIEAIDPKYTKKLGVFDVVDHVIMYTAKMNPI